MRLTKENILSTCGKYLYVFYKNKKFGYWENTYPNHIFAINKFGFVCENCEIHYFNHYLGENCRVFISDSDYYFRLEDMNQSEEVDKESLRNFIKYVENDYSIVYNQEYVNKLNRQIYELKRLLKNIVKIYCHNIEYDEEGLTLKTAEKFLGWRKND